MKNKNAKTRLNLVVSIILSLLFATGMVVYGWIFIAKPGIAQAGMVVYCASGLCMFLFGVIPYQISLIRGR